jgi:hypothetical protein
MNLTKCSRLIGLLLAWVMWSKTEKIFPFDPTYERWIFAEAFSTQSQCLSMVRDSLEKMKKLPEQFPTLKGMFTNFNEQGYLFNSDSSILRTTYLCVPDTIDPRPKG